MSERENEKELILGNTQLISLFFVVVALCGVFFALGYMIGRNSTKPVVAGADTPAQAPASPGAREEPPSEPPVAAAPAAPTPDTGTPAPAPADPPPAQTAAAQPAPEVPVKPAAAAAKPAAPEAADAPLEPGAMWLQVAALRRDDATKLMKTLREQDFPARLADSPKPEFFRVLVGPYRQTAQVADAKAKLKSLGFANAFVQK
ncbi:MAG TPA: SPOR domain-containing protein [Bryobacteraceae bacterium]|nr:SPOR domain-containing protein [Bryobacteraceae bacterium]